MIGDKEIALAEEIVNDWVRVISDLLRKRMMGIDVEQGRNSFYSPKTKRRDIVRIFKSEINFPFSEAGIFWIEEVLGWDIRGYRDFAIEAKKWWKDIVKIRDKLIEEGYECPIPLRVWVERGYLPEGKSYLMSKFVEETINISKRNRKYIRKRRRM